MKKKNCKVIYTKLPFLLFCASNFFSLLVFLGYPTCIFFTENVTIASLVIGSTTSEKAMVTFSVKNIQIGHPKNTNKEKKIDGRKNIFFVLNVFNTPKKKEKKK